MVSFRRRVGSSPDSIGYGKFSSPADKQITFILQGVTNKLKRFNLLGIVTSRPINKRLYFAAFENKRFYFLSYPQKLKGFIFYIGEIKRFYFWNGKENITL